MRNITAIIIFTFLLCIVMVATYCQIKFGQSGDVGLFIVTALTALGTCGVTILSLFPYIPKDRLSPDLYMRKDGVVMLRIFNKTNHTVYIGSDKHDTACCSEDYAFWYPEDAEINFDNAKILYTKPGDNLAIPPHLSIYYPIDRRIFGGHNLTKIRMQIRTSSGYVFNVNNKIHTTTR